MSASSSSSYTSLSSLSRDVIQRATFIPDIINQRFRLLRSPKEKSELAKWPELDTEVQTQLYALRSLTDPIFEDLQKFADTKKGAVKFSRRQFVDLPYSLTIISKTGIFIHTGKSLGFGTYKKIKELLSLSTLEKYVIATPRQNTLDGHRRFLRDIHHEGSICTQFSGQPSIPKCFAVEVANAAVLEKPKGLVLEQYDCDGFEFRVKKISTLELDQKELFRVQVIKNLIAGVATLHANEVAHMDLKCSNYIVKLSNADVAIIDFGFAVDFKLSKLPKIFAGTTDFRPPEISKYLYGFQIAFDELYNILTSNFRFNERTEFFGETISHEEVKCDEEKFRKRVLQKLAFSYDIWSLGLVIGFLYYSEPHKLRNLNSLLLLLNEQTRYEPRDLFASLLLQMLSLNCQKRPSIFQVQQRFAEIFDK